MTTPGADTRPQGEYALHVEVKCDDLNQVMLNNALRSHLTSAVTNAVTSWNKMMTGIKPDAGDRGTAVVSEMTWTDTDGVATQ